jgi:threonine/homoserine/homoserine lactone efflux protein
MMLSFFIRGILLGGAAASQPGPFQAYLLGRTMKNGWKHTLPAAFAPLFSDGPVVILMLFFISSMPAWMLPLIRGAGGFYLLYLAWNAFSGIRNPVAAGTESPDSARRSLFQAVFVNFLNPGPYIFWGTVAGPILLEGMRGSIPWGIGFLAGFYITLIGGFLLFIILCSAAGRLGTEAQKGMSIFSALVLLGFGLYLLQQAVSGIT